MFCLNLYYTTAVRLIFIPLLQYDRKRFSYWFQTYNLAVISLQRFYPECLLTLITNRHAEHRPQPSTAIDRYSVKKQRKFQGKIKIKMCTNCFYPRASPLYLRITILTKLWYISLISSYFILNLPYSHWFNIQFLVPTAFQEHKILANRWHLVTRIWQWIFQSRGLLSLHWMRKLTKLHLNSQDTPHSWILSGLTQQAQLIHILVLVQPVLHSGSPAHLFY